MVIKMLVIGGTGMTGKAVLQRAIKNNDIEVTALVRTASRLPSDVQDKIKVIVGDIMNMDNVNEAIQGQDVVVSCLGKRLLDQGHFTVYSKGMENIIEGMRNNNVQYLHFLGVSPFLPGSFRIPYIFFPMMKESGKMMDYIKTIEDIVWVGTLAPNISDTDYTGDYQVKIDKLPGGMNATKGDVADWMVTSTIDQAKMEEYKHQTVGISSMSTSFCSLM